MLRVGLTGGIAAGKTHVLRQLAAAGFHTLELDRLAHELCEPGGPAYDPVVGAFGREILRADGTIDRALLGARVFGDARARARLGAIVHPLVRAEEEVRAKALAETAAPGLVSEAALLVEAGVHLRFDRLVVVHCGEEQQLERLRRRDGLDEAAALKRIRAQMPGRERRRFAQLEVEASGTLADTAKGVARLLARLRELTSGRFEGVVVRPDRKIACLCGGPRQGPRGLSPARLLRAMVASGGVELEGLARELSPPHAGPWYEAAEATPEGPGPETIVAPIVLWALARRGDDPPFLLAAASSIARLTHSRREAVAEACFVARALQELAIRGEPPNDLEDAMRTWRRDAARWGGAPVGPRVLGVVSGALRGEVGSRNAADAELAGAFRGLRSGQTVAGVPEGLAADLDALDDL